jgi:transposase
MQTPLNVGVDVAKDQVMVACAQGSFATHSIPNRRTPLLGWLHTLPAGSRIGMEATGDYHRSLADLAHGIGLVVYVLNPKDTRYYARGLGRRAKTDRVDAELIARYIAHEHPGLHPYMPASPEQRLLDQTLRRRAHLVSMRVALLATTEELQGLETECQAAVERLTALITALEARLKQLLESSQERQQAVRQLRSIPGVGPIVSAALVAALQRLPFPTADAFVAYTGLDPRPCDSGKKIGRRRLSKRGPAYLRCLLFNAAMAGCSTKTWHSTYQRHRQRGLSTTQALVVLARKIARIAWSLHHHHAVFDPAKAIPA